MHALDQTFGIARSLLSTPSQSNWKTLCGYLDRYEPFWHEPMFVERFRHYVVSQLDRWPTDMPRYAQHTWVTRALRGQDVPQLALCTALQFVSQEATEAQVATMFHYPDFERMKRIDLRAATVGIEGAFAIARNASLTHLEHLDLRRAGVPWQACEAIRESFPSCEILW